MDIPLLQDIVTLFALAIVVLWCCHRLHVPTMVGLLVTGAVAGPHGLGLVGAAHDVEHLAELGVVLLLFTIGIECSLNELVRLRKSVLLGGSLQVLLTLAIAWVVARALGATAGQSIFMGLLVALSSTAIVLKLLQEQADSDSPHGRTTLAILIFQDLMVVPMMMLTPLLAGAHGPSESTLWIQLLKSGGVLIVVVLSARWVVPHVLHQIARTRSRELFLLTIIVICFAVAWLTSQVGLSLALGAFLAGLIISESEYSYQALGNILPLRDMLTSIFFISIGMLFDSAELLEHPGRIALLAGGVILLKSVIAGGVSLLVGLPLRAAILVGIALSQVGEFAFVLAKTGQAYGLLKGELYQLFLAAAVLTMAATPFLLRFGPSLAGWVLRAPLPLWMKAGLRPLSRRSDVAQERPQDHLLVIGYGVNGQNVTRAAQLADVPYVVIEMNPDTVRRERARGEPLYYGDATQETVLSHAGVESARVMVITVADAAAVRCITALARRLNPQLHIIARTRYLQEMPELHQLGVDEVIPEEFETSVEIFTRVLTRYLVPRAAIDQFVADVRAEGYGMLRSLPHAASASSLWQRALSDLDIHTFQVDLTSPLVGVSLAEVAFRQTYGVTVLAIRRDGQTLANLAGNTILKAGDQVIILGSPAQLAGLSEPFAQAESA